MSEMIERVARAIYGHIDQRGEAYKKARAAIEAMREPTEEMERAYYAACDVNGMCLWKPAYRAMIDATLAVSSKEL